MKIFISWSGQDSLQIAKILRDWIPNVIQVAAPYVSAEDIDKGTRWATDISKELDDSSYGIICLTKNNIQAPWINFEAGALGKKVDKSRVSPFLFKIKPSEVTGPVLQFQHTRSDDKSDILKLMLSINKQASFLSEERLAKAFEQWWPSLNEALSAVPDVDADASAKSTKSTSNSEIQNLSKIVESLLDISRTNHQLLRSPDVLLPEDYINKVINKDKRRLDDLSDVTSDLSRALNSVNRLKRSLVRGVLDENSIDECIDSLSEIIKELDTPITYMINNYGNKDKSLTLTRSTRTRRPRLAEIFESLSDSDDKTDTP